MWHKLGERKSRQHLCVPRYTLSHTHTHTSVICHSFITSQTICIWYWEKGGNHTAPGDLYSHTMSKKQVKTAVWRRTDRLVKLALLQSRARRSHCHVHNTVTCPEGSTHTYELTDLSFAPPENHTFFGVFHREKERLLGKESKCKVFLFIWVHCVPE
jgi:hypothetical protein